MMFSRSTFRWLVLAGIMFFMSGLLLNRAASKQGKVHLILGMPLREMHHSEETQDKDAPPEPLGFALVLDSLAIEQHSPKYELQVREMDEEFSQLVHTGIPPPSRLVEAFPLSPIKIHKIRDTEFRFRLKQFYPDFSFKYSYPENWDTIQARAPGITLNLVMPGKEEVVTLRSDKSSLSKLDDVLGFGCTLEFFWTMSKDSLYGTKTNIGNNEHKIVFSGRDKKVYLLFNGILDSLPLENNHFYPIPGRDSFGLVILQYFPDARWLKAMPVSKSEKLLNPVTEVEAWKKGGSAQNLYLYPNAGGRHGGEWRVPGSNLLLTCTLSHLEILKASTCRITIIDSLHQVNVSKVLTGDQIITYGGRKFRLEECDADGIWANIRIWSSPGDGLGITGMIFGLAGLLGFLFSTIKKRTSRTIPA